MIRQAICLFLVLCFTEAVVVFNNTSTGSRIYDEFDFKGQSTVIVPDLCTKTCRIYASITPDSKKLAANLLIQLPKGFASVADIAAKLDVSTSKKGFLEVTNAASLSIVNANAQFAAGPLVLYIVNSENIYPENPEPEVYEAEGLRRPESTIPVSVTVMSARPFTLNGAPLSGQRSQGVIATMSGFDNMEFGICPYLYYSINNPAPFPGFTMQVNGPIISLQYDYYDYNYPPGELTATLGITNKFNGEMARNGWFGSPGFHGCPGKEPYRSSLYNFNAPFHADISTLKKQSITVDVVTNTDEGHAVTVKNVDSGASYSVSNTPADTHASYSFMHAKNVSINWVSDGTGNTHFLARWHTYETRMLPLSDWL